MSFLVVPSRSFKRPSFLGADFHFWSWLGLTRNGHVRQSYVLKNISSFLSFFTFLPALFVSIQQQYRVVRIPQVECWSKSGLGRQASWAVHGCMALVHGILGLPSLFWGTWTCDVISGWLPHEIDLFTLSVCFYMIHKYTTNTTLSKAR